MDNGEPLSPIARMWHEPVLNIHVVAVLGFKTKINREVVKSSNLVRSLLKHPRFSSLQVKDEKKVMRWVPTNVNLNDHIVEPSLKKPIDSPDKFVEDYIYNLSKTTIKESMPLWDFHILNLKIKEAESVAIFRAHHSIGDGLSLMSILLSGSRKLSDPNAIPTIPGKKNLESRYSCGTSRIWAFLVGFLSILVLIWNTILDSVLHLATICFLTDTQTPLKSSSRASESDVYARRIVHRTVDLDDIKFVKNSMDVTVNDVLTGVIEAGLSRYLNRKYGKEKDEEPVKGKNYLPKNMRIRGVVFINLRSFQAVCAMDEMLKKNTRDKWGNKFGYVLLPLKIAMRKDPLEYVREAKATMDRKKASLEANLTYLMARIFLTKCSPLIGSVITKGTLYYSNVPGPREEISLCGYPVAFVAPTAYGQPLALTIHVASYSNKIKFVLAVDDSVIPDSEKLLDDFEQSLILIKDAVVAANNYQKKNADVV